MPNKNLRDNNPEIQKKLSLLKKKQDVWMSSHKKNNDTMLWTAGSHGSDYTGFVVRKGSSSVSKTPNSSRSQPSSNCVSKTPNSSQSQPSSSAYKTPNSNRSQSSSSAYKTPNSSQSQPSSHSSLKDHGKKSTSTKRPTSAKSEKFIKSISLQKEVKPEGTKICPQENNQSYSFLLCEENVIDILSQLDTSEQEEYDHTKYEFGNTVLYNNTVDQPQKIMAKHVCKLCKQLMIGDHQVPHMVYPCGHSFCFTCIAGEKYCPRCNCSISSIEQNETLLKLIKLCETQKEQEKFKRKEEEARKYIGEYKSLKTRTDAMKGM